MAQTQEYNIKKDKRIQEIIENHDINNMGFHLVTLKRMHRPRPLLRMALLDNNGQIVEQFDDVFYEGFNGHDSMKKFLIPITYSREYTEKYHNVPRIVTSRSFEKFVQPVETPCETPVKRGAQIDPDFARCTYIDERGYIYDDRHDRFFIYQLINSKFSELPKLINQIKINISKFYDPKQEIFKLDLFRKILTARVQNENPKVSEIQALEEAYDNRMDELKEQMKTMHLKQNGDKEYFEERQNGE